MDNQELLDHLLDAYERANTSGETAIRLGIGYSVRNHMFSLNINDVTHTLSDNYVADFAEGGDALVEDVKRWAQGGSVG